MQQCNYLIKGFDDCVFCRRNSGHALEMDSIFLCDLAELLVMHLGITSKLPTDMLSTFQVSNHNKLCLINNISELR